MTLRVKESVFLGQKKEGKISGQNQNSGRLMMRREEERLDRPPGDDNQTTGQYLGPLFASWEDHLADRRESCTR